ncbi:GT2 family glycosyltransferase [Frondihabitans sp. PhB188]|uniref:glycosyltransferase family 2 protein n=1 Tax=Frondihabitans sp. PhB188 TaxID=2485200 RepID=UPI000F47978D|nr:glycosyltransferase family 2 protein [Frondihabitans sp. PhB188]ROQ36637.1 GT2 family glycosyltransferase [Frondihabitans sp. PhB188]
MRASVVVVNWKQPELTLRALDALAAQEIDEPYEVVLVENEAVPGAVDVFRAAHPDVVLVEEASNSGFAGGVTRGIAAASGEVVVLVNNDAVPDPAFLREGLAALDAGGPEVAAVSAAVVLEGLFVRTSGRGDDVLVGLDGTAWRRAGAQELPSGLSLMNGTGVELTRDGNGYDRDWLRPVADVSAADGSPDADPFGFSGGAAFIRRAALAEVGGFDETLFMYYEDLDLSWRLRLAGYRIGFAPKARIVHLHAGSSSSGSELIRRQSMRNRLAVVLRNGSPGMVGRVAVRTLVRMLKDLVGPGGAYLPRASWGRIAREVPSLVSRSVRGRERPEFLRASRREVESRLR